MGRLLMPLMLAAEGYPVVTVKQVAGLLNISFPAANKAIEELVARGMLAEPFRRR